MKNAKTTRYKENKWHKEETNKSPRKFLGLGPLLAAKGQHQLAQALQSEARHWQAK